MPTGVTVYAPGTFCWVDLSTTEPAASKAFYAKLFGWTFQDQPDEPYTMLIKDGQRVAGLAEMSAEECHLGAHTNWHSYVAVTDVDQAVRKAVDLGGKLLQPGMDVPKAGRMAAMQDPTGAMLWLWQGNEMPGAQMTNMPGSMCWNELMTTNPGQASQFYTHLFGWETQQMPTPGGSHYTLFTNQKTPVGDIMEFPQITTAWLVYFAVDDCDKTVSQAEALKASVLRPPTDIPSVGRFAILKDPQGCYFAVIKTLPRQ